MTKKKTPLAKPPASACLECETKLARLEKHYAELLTVNRVQLDRLCQYERQLEQARAVIARLEKK